MVNHADLVADKMETTFENGSAIRNDVDYLA